MFWLWVICSFEIGKSEWAESEWAKSFSRFSWSPQTISGRTFCPLRHSGFSFCTVHVFWLWLMCNFEIGKSEWGESFYRFSWSPQTISGRTFRPLRPIPIPVEKIYSFEMCFALYLSYLYLYCFQTSCGLLEGIPVLCSSIRKILGVLVWFRRFRASNSNN